MIVGNGDIGTALTEIDHSGKLFFASGVSNSQCLDEKEYKRERDLLLEQYTGSHIVYFSSLAVFYSQTRYTRHKLDMEQMIKSNFKKYCIVRLGNIDFGTNPHTIINYFKNELAKGHKLELRDEVRYITSKSELLHWCELIPDWSVEMNITGKMMSISDIVEEYCL